MQQASQLPAAPASAAPQRPDLPAWAQWRRTCGFILSIGKTYALDSILANPLLAPAPVAASTLVPASPPPRSGLFGIFSYYVVRDV